MAFIYTEEQIKEMIYLRENEGGKPLAYPKVVKAMREKYVDTPFTSSSIGNAYRYYSKHSVTQPEDGLRDTAKLHRAQINARIARSELKKIVESIIYCDDVVTKINESIQRLPKIKLPPIFPINKKTKRNGQKMTVEVLFSELQIGKIVGDGGYNSEIAKNRIIEYAMALILKIKQHIHNGYNVERIVLAFLGDIIESSEKHPNSARATDCSTPHQVVLAIDYIFEYLILPLAHLGIQLDIVAVTGNHDHDDHGIKMFEPGIEQLSWIIYQTLKSYTKYVGLKNVSYTIPRGYYTHTEIYGHTIVYEHGVGIAAAEKPIAAKRQRRSEQLERYVTYFRMGDKHNISRFNEDTLVVNGAFFGNDKTATEFSGILGFNSRAAQIVMFHVEREENSPLLSIYDSFVIQLQHIK